ncbi:collagenase-like [Chironomus tepperi]|uniref:collagenase-like n=1 Tax=Chironomus tepperi TaxID=113505 RepID=UPI00391FBA51
MAVNSKNIKNERIFGGTAAKDGQFPHMVDLSVYYHGKFYHICGGALIHSNWIITAGHCAYYVRELNLELNVTLGVTDITNGPHKWSELVSNDDIVIHENYTDDGNTAVNDLALIRVNKTIFYTNILPIRLPSESDIKSFDGQTGILSGWGFNMNRNKSEPNILQYIEEKILTNDECSAQNVNYPAIVDSEICISSNNGKTACPGDSGSPLVVRNDKLGDILVGIASYVDIGKVCNSENNGPVVFMRVSHFMDWIQETTGLKFS